MSQYAHLSIVDPEFAQAAANVTAPEPTDDMQLRRERFKGLMKMANERDKALIPPDSELRIEEHKVPVDGGEIAVRCMIPTPTGGSSGTFPVLVNYHGGGFIVGDLEVDKISLQQACVEQQVSVVDVDYRLAPELPWPIPQNDSYAALKWAAENTALLSADLSKGFVVRGTSAGGNLAASMALRARDDAFFDGRPLTGQILQVPAVVSPHNIPDKYKSELLSLDMPFDPRFFNRSGVLDYNRHWNPDVTDIYTFPLLHPNHAGLVPAVVQVCGLDPLRDEGLLYERLLREAGVKTKLHTYAGVPHGFYGAFPQIKLAKEYQQDLKDGLRWLLGGAI